MLDKLIGRLPHVNASKFSRSIIVRSIARGAEESIWPLLDYQGPHRIEILIEENRSLVDIILSNKLPDSWQSFINQAPNMNWILQVIQEKDLMLFIPPWAQKLVTRDEKSYTWFLNEIDIIKRRIFNYGN